MNKLIVGIVVAILAIAGAATAIYWFAGDDDEGESTGDITVVDHSGRTVTFEGSPTRIMAMGSSFIETLIYLDCMDEIAVINESSIPRLEYEYPDLGKKDSIKSASNASAQDNAEFAVSRGVDCVIMWGYSSEAMYVNAGLTVLKLYPKDMDSIKDTISILGIVMGKESAAEDLNDKINSTIEDIRNLAQTAAGPSYGSYKRVYMELDTVSEVAYKSPTGNSITGTLLNILGVDYMNKEGTSVGSLPVDTESILAYNPDYMIFMGPRDDGNELRGGDIDGTKFGGGEPVIDIYNKDTNKCFNGNWASATPSVIKGLVYLYNLIYEDDYVLSY